MAVEVILPKLGATMDEGTILAWKKREGEAIAQGEPLFEVETDKVVMEVEAPASGVLRKILTEAGSVVPVGQVIAIIAGADEELPEAPAPLAMPSVAGSGLPPGTASQVPGIVPSPQEGVLASPAAKKLAREHGVYLQSITGTGPGGRIVEKDVERVIAAARSAPVEGLRPPPAAPGEAAPLSRLRKKTAERMAESFQTIPHFYLTVEVPADHLVGVRESLLPPVQAEVGIRLSFTDLFVRCVALALRKHPLVNASWRGQEIRWNPEINIGIAMATPEGLVVPVIHRADTLTVAQIAGARARLEVEAKEHRLALPAIEGGTFTVTNLGSFGIDTFSPIINPPQAAILAVGRLAPRAVERQGSLSLLPTVFLTLAVDHRVLDGAQAAAFLRDLKAQIEHGRI
jgi:pyruvate dehydrogenase E2 component (dihydrolipoamide acetyltransferase)